MKVIHICPNCKRTEYETSFTTINMYKEKLEFENDYPVISDEIRRLFLPKGMKQYQCETCMYEFDEFEINYEKGELK